MSCRLDRIYGCMLAGVSLALVAACGSADVIINSGSRQPVVPGAPTAGAPRTGAAVSGARATDTLTAADVGAAQRAFGLDLLHATCATGPGRNVGLSATSAAEALGLLYAAAAGDTASKLGAVLHQPAWDRGVIAAVASHTTALSDIRGPKEKEGLFLSNHVWSAKGSHPTQRYLDDIATGYHSDARSVDFAGDSAGATHAINESVNKDTNGLIKKLFDQPLGRDTTTVLTNALYLKARWVEPFELTSPAHFQAPTGVVHVPMMTGASGQARAAAGWRSVQLPYVGDKLTALVILPPAGIDPCILATMELDALTSGPTTAVDVQLPKLHFEQSHDLLGTLTMMGVPTAGDYSGLGGGGVSAIVQKTYLDVDEHGTTAAAATGIAIAAAGRVSTAAPLVFDRPFLFLLTDNATQSPLFTAVVTDPSQHA
jgi:serpin B